jgi:anti-sigma-K factor RskA
MSTAVASPTPEPAAPAPPPAKLDEVMLAMDVVDTLRHREILVERELNEEQREAQLVERLRALYTSQGIEVTDAVLQQGVRALKESRFVYTPPPPSFGRTLATLWVRRGTYGKALAVGLTAIGVLAGAYNLFVAAPQRRAAEEARIELSETLPRQLAAAHQAVVAEARVDEARTRAEAILGQGRAALQRGDTAQARAAIGELDQLGQALRTEYTLRIAGRPNEQTGFWRERGFGQGRSYYIVVNAVDGRGQPVSAPIRNIETNQIETVSRFAVAVPLATFDAVRNDKARNGIVQNDRLGEKRRGFLEPEFRMPVLEGRLTRWAER